MAPIWLWAALDVVLLQAALGALVTLSLSAAAAGQTPSVSRPLPSRSIAVTASVPPVVLSTDQLLTLERWSRHYEEWAVWFGHAGTAAEPASQSARPHPEPPNPPVWLPSACSQVIDDGGTLINACHDFQDWLNGDPGATRTRQQLAMDERQPRPAHS